MLLRFSPSSSRDMHIPPHIRIPVCIEQGSVFNFFLHAEGFGRESKNRYFVVLNRDPKTDSVLILVTSTTQITKKLDFVRNAGIVEKTIVTVSPQEYPNFTHDSAFNCNDVHQVCMKDLIRKVEKSGADGYPKIPYGIIKKLINGVRMSPRVTREIKKLL